MHIVVVTNDQRIPYDLASQPQVAAMTLADFLSAATDGSLEIDSGGALWVNVSYLDEHTYRLLVSFFLAEDDGSSFSMLHFFRFEDQTNPPYKINEPITICPLTPPVVEPAPVPVQPVVPTPVVSAPVDPTPVVPTPIHPVEHPAPVEVPVEPEHVPMAETVPQQMPELPITEIENTINDDPTQEEMEQAINVANGTLNIPQPDIANAGTRRNLDIFLKGDAEYIEHRPKKAKGKVKVIGSSKGGVGKTTTGLMLVFAYAQLHPDERVAFADFDVIDGQVSAAIHKQTPTLYQFYQAYQAGHKSFSYLENCRVKSEYFGSNVDFYLAPPQDIPAVTNDEKFWSDVFELLITNYDAVFFDTAIDYLDKKPVSMLYKIADTNYIVTNTSMFSIKSIIKQLRNLNGDRDNNEYSRNMHILNRTKVIVTRVSSDEADVGLNKYIISLINEYAPVVGAFGNIDPIINKIQWYQYWDLLNEDANPQIWNMLCQILEDDEPTEDE